MRHHVGRSSPKLSQLLQEYLHVVPQDRVLLPQESVPLLQHVDGGIQNRLHLLLKLVSHRLQLLDALVVRLQLIRHGKLHLS